MEGISDETQKAVDYESNEEEDTLDTKEVNHCIKTTYQGK